MIKWPDFIFPPINLWVIGPYRGSRSDKRDCTELQQKSVSKEGNGRAHQSRCVGPVTGVEKCSVSQPGQGRNTRDSRWVRPTYTQSELLWSTIKTHR